MVFCGKYLVLIILNFMPFSPSSHCSLDLMGWLCCKTTWLIWTLAMTPCMIKWMSAKGLSSDYIYCHWQSWWRHQMEASSALLALCAGISPSTVNSPNKGQWRGALMFLWSAPWINGIINIREADDSGRHRAHYDFIVIFYCGHRWCYATLFPSEYTACR